MLTIPGVPLNLQMPVLLGIGGVGLAGLLYWLWTRQQAQNIGVTGPGPGAMPVDGGLAPPGLFAQCPSATPYHHFGGPQNGHCMSDCAPGYRKGGAACVWGGGAQVGAFLANAAVHQAAGALLRRELA